MQGCMEFHSNSLVGVGQMAFKETSSVIRYVRSAEHKAGDVLVEGHYAGLVPSSYGDNHKFITLDGEIVVINKSGSLNYKMQAVKVNDYVRITHMGEEKLTKGLMAGKKCWKYKVEVDPDRSGLNNNPTPSNEAVPNTTDEATDLF